MTDEAVGMRSAPGCHTRSMTEPGLLRESVDRYDNGNLRFRGQLQDDAMHGHWEFFRRDGSLMRAGNFDRGRQVGTWRTYGRDGRTVKETRFADPG
jgi:antitoxin component YwqK of YwqJK toxin-antitoxin module